jgi:tRNA (mo5U34)-methyltransferase
MSSSVIDDRRSLAFHDCLAAHEGWYHSMEFPDGTRVEGHMTLDILRQRYADFGLPEDLHGKRALDIGAWDGWFSFEMERHGADVTAVDIVAVPHFETARQRMRSRVRYIVSDIYNLPRHNPGQFDYVLFLGVLYHIRHPLLALDIVCGLTRDTAIIDSFVVDGGKGAHIDAPLPYCEFYETDELGGNLDNWFGPSIDCLLAFCRSAGFVRVRLLNVRDRHARVICHRHWEPPPPHPAVPAPVLVDARHNWNSGVLFSSDKEEYLSCWFRCDAGELTRDQVLPEVGEFAAPVLVIRKMDAGVFVANVRIPPGLAPGAHVVRLRLDASAYSNQRIIFLDTPLRAGQFSILKVCDGVDWTENRISLAAGGYLTIWITGLPGDADLASTELYAGNLRIPLTYVGPVLPDGARQLNAQLITVLGPGQFGLYVRQGTGVSDIVQITVDPL